MDDAQRSQEIGGPLDLKHRMGLHLEETPESPGLNSAKATGFLALAVSLDSVAS
jgi:hypothetical protein